MDWPACGTRTAALLLDVHVKQCAHPFPLAPRVSLPLAASPKLGMKDIKGTCKRIEREEGERLLRTTLRPTKWTSHAALGQAETAPSGRTQQAALGAPPVAKVSRPASLPAAMPERSSAGNSASKRWDGRLPSPTARVPFPRSGRLRLRRPCADHTPGPRWPEQSQQLSARRA